MDKWRLVALLLCVALTFGGCGANEYEQPIWQDETYPDGSPALTVETYPNGNLKQEIVYDEAGNIESIRECYEENGENKRYIIYEDGNIVYETGFDPRGAEIYTVCYEYEYGKLSRQEICENGQWIVSFFDEQGELKDRSWLDQDGRTRRVEIYFPGKSEPFVYEAKMECTTIASDWLSYGGGPDDSGIYEIADDGTEYFVAYISPDGVIDYENRYTADGKVLKEPVAAERGGYVKYTYDDAGNCINLTFFSDDGEMELSCDCPYEGCSIRYSHSIWIGDVCPTIIEVINADGVEIEHQYYIDNVLDHCEVLDKDGRCKTWIQYKPNGSVLKKYNAPYEGYEVWDFDLYDGQWSVTSTNKDQSIWCWDYFIDGKLFRRCIYRGMINGNLVGYYKFSPDGVCEIAHEISEGAVRMEFETYARDRVRITEYDADGDEVYVRAYPFTIWPGF